MANPGWKACIAKYIVPPMEQLNRNLLDHEFSLFPLGKVDVWVELKKPVRLHERLLLQRNPVATACSFLSSNFRLPGKQQGWRQMTLNDYKPTMSVDVQSS